MILIDTSVWIDHIRLANGEIAEMIADGGIVQHDYVTGELAMGAIARREAMLETLCRLPPAPIVSLPDLLGFVGRHELYGTGIGFVDAHLLAAAYTQGARLWTRDRRLYIQADRLRLAFVK